MTDHRTQIPPDAELELRERMTQLEMWREMTEPVINLLTFTALIAGIAFLAITLKRRSR